MALSWKLVIDSTNAPAQADFWAAALEYEVEDPSTLIQQLLAAGRIGAEAVVEHRGRQIFRGTPRSATPRMRTTRRAASAAAGGCCFRRCPNASPGRTACTSMYTVSQAASTCWRLGWKSWGQSASARSTRDLPGTGGSCRILRATSSARLSRERGLWWYVAPSRHATRPVFRQGAAATRVRKCHRTRPL